ncbi:unnamed protein product [Phaedon cochleariae]|uniref:Uncharacterized protein n=1 Tax=Phaedon cochleariae TaxID=80249 RepID=A0A9P0GSN9_PHACE|nr:unnamed protein product [Phaedon cochleariae]
MEHYKKRLIRCQTRDHQTQKLSGLPCQEENVDNETSKDIDFPEKISTCESHKNVDRKAMRQKKIARKRAVCRAKFRHTNMELFKLGTSMPTSLCKTKQPYNVCTEKTLQLTCENKPRNSKKPEEPLPKEAITEFIINSIEGNQKDLLPRSKSTEHSNKTTGRHSLPQLVPEMPLKKKVRFSLGPNASENNERQAVAKRRKTVIGTETFMETTNSKFETEPNPIENHPSQNVTVPLHSKSTDLTASYKPSHSEAVTTPHLHHNLITSPIIKEQEKNHTDQNFKEGLGELHQNTIHLRAIAPKETPNKNNNTIAYKDPLVDLGSRTNEEESRTVAPVDPSVDLGLRTHQQGERFFQPQDPRSQKTTAPGDLGSHPNESFEEGTRLFSSGNKRNSHEAIAPGATFDEGQKLFRSQNSRDHRRKYPEDPSSDMGFHNNAFKERPPMERRQQSGENQPINLSVKQPPSYPASSKTDSMPTQTRVSYNIFPEIKEQITRLGNTTTNRQTKTRTHDKKIDDLIKYLVETSKAAMTTPFSIRNLLIMNKNYRELQIYLMKTCVSKKAKLAITATMNELISYVSYKIFGESNNMHFRLYTEKLLDTTLENHKAELENFLNSSIYSEDDDRFREFFNWIGFISREIALSNRQSVLYEIPIQYQNGNVNYNRPVFMENHGGREKSSFPLSNPPYLNFPTTISNPHLNPQFPTTISNGMSLPNPHIPANTLPYPTPQFPIPNSSLSTSIPSSITLQSQLATSVTVLDPKTSANPMPLPNPQFPKPAPQFPTMPLQNPYTTASTLPYSITQFPMPNLKLSTSTTASSSQLSTSSLIAMPPQSSTSVTVSDPQFSRASANPMPLPNPQFPKTASNTMPLLNPYTTATTLPTPQFPILKSKLSTSTTTSSLQLSTPSSILMPSQPSTTVGTMPVPNPQYLISPSLRIPPPNTQISTATTESNPQNHTKITVPQNTSSVNEKLLKICNLKSKYLEKDPEASITIDDDPIREKDSIEENRKTKSVIVKEKPMEITKVGRSLKEIPMDDVEHQEVLEKIRELEQMREISTAKVIPEHLEKSPDFQLFKEILKEEDRDVYKKVLKKLVRVKKDTARAAVILIDDDEDTSIRKVRTENQPYSIDLTEKKKLPPFLIDLTNTRSKTSKSSNEPPRKKIKKNLPLRIFNEILVIDDDDTSKPANKDENQNCIEKNKESTEKWCPIIEDISDDESQSNPQQIHNENPLETTKEIISNENEMETEGQKPCRKNIITSTRENNINAINNEKDTDTAHKETKEISSVDKTEHQDVKFMSAQTKPSTKNICTASTTAQKNSIDTSKIPKSDVANKEIFLGDNDSESRSNIISLALTETDSKTNKDTKSKPIAETNIPIEKGTETNFQVTHEKDMDCEPVQSQLETSSSSKTRIIIIHKKTEAERPEDLNTRDTLLERLKAKSIRGNIITPTTNETEISTYKDSETYMIEERLKNRDQQTYIDSLPAQTEEPIEKNLNSSLITTNTTNNEARTNGTEETDDDTKLRTHKTSIPLIPKTVISATKDIVNADKTHYQNIQSRRKSVISPSTTHTNTCTNNAEQLKPMVYKTKPDDLNVEPREDNILSSPETDTSSVITNGVIHIRPEDISQPLSVISNTTPLTETAKLHARPRIAQPANKTDSDSERHNQETGTVIHQTQPEASCLSRLSNPASEAVFLQPTTQEGNGAIPRSASAGRDTFTPDGHRQQWFHNGPSSSRSHSVPLAWHPWLHNEQGRGASTSRRQSVETISNAGSDYSPTVAPEATVFEIRLDSKWYRISKNLYDKIPKGKLRYVKENNAFVRYCDGYEMEQFVENISEAQHNEELKGRFIRLIRHCMYLGPVHSGEVIEMSGDVKFSSDAYVSEPETYSEEVSKVERFIPSDFFGFYLYVTGFQIVHGNPPISFHTFLMMHNTNRTLLLLKKYIYNLLRTGIVNFSFTSQDS